MSSDPAIDSLTSVNGALGEVSPARGLEGATGMNFPAFAPIFSDLFFSLLPTTEVTNFTHVRPFGGKSFSFANYEAKVILWNQIPTLGPQGRAATLLLQMTDIARMICMTVGRDHIGENGGSDLRRARLMPFTRT